MEFSHKGSGVRLHGLLQQTTQYITHSALTRQLHTHTVAQYWHLAIDLPDLTFEVKFGPNAPTDFMSSLLQLVDLYHRDLLITEFPCSQMLH